MIIWGTSNLPNGGESNSIFGMILVTYPENSLLSISGGYALKKDISATQRLYYVKSSGIYTITSTNTQLGQTISKAVEISNYGQSVSFELIYPFWLIRNGKFVNGISYEMVGPETSTLTEDEGGYVSLITAGASSTYTTVYFEGINLSKYNSIVFDGQAAGYYSTSKYCPAVGVLSSINSGASNSVFTASEYNVLSKATSKNYTERSYSIVSIASDNSTSSNIGFQCCGQTTNKVPGGIKCYNLYLYNIDSV